MMKNIFVINGNIVAVLVSLVLTALSYGIGYLAKWQMEPTLLEGFSVFTSYWCTYLCVFQSRLNYPIGAISVAALGFLFYNQGLYGSAALQAWLFPSLLYGWIRWGSDTNTRPVTTLKSNLSLLGYASVTIISYVLALYTNKYLGGEMAMMDSSILVLSIFAQFMLDNKKLENWLIWILVNIISVYVYTEQGLYIVAIQMGLFGFNALWGLYEWHKTMNIHTTAISAIEKELLTT